MRYYSTQRPVAPGSFPSPDGNRVTAITNFNERTFVEAIHREAWGYIEYEKPISDEEIIDFELTPETFTTILKVTFIGMDDCYREVYRDEKGRLWKYPEPGEAPRERHDRLYSSTGNDIEGEPCWPMKPSFDYIIEERGNLQ